MQIPDIVCTITIFTDLPSTANLARVNKTLHVIITQHKLFVLLKIFYIDFHTPQFYSPKLDRNNLMRSCRYLFYKIASRTDLWEPHPANKIYPADGCYNFYRDIYYDDLIELPKYFNPVYNRNYYVNRFVNQIKTYDKSSYYIKLSSLIKYYRNPTWTPAFDKFINKLPKDKILAFTNTEFADNFTICVLPQNHVLHTFSKYVDNYLCFVYDQMIYYITIDGLYDQRYININCGCSNYTTSNILPQLIHDLQRYFTKRLQITESTCDALIDLLLTYLY